MALLGLSAMGSLQLLFSAAVPLKKQYGLLSDTWASESEGVELERSLELPFWAFWNVSCGGEKKAWRSKLQECAGGIYASEIPAQAGAIGRIFAKPPCFQSI